MLSAGKMREELATPLSDADIREYLPHALILKYSEIDEYGSLHNLLPEVKSYCIILYEDSPNVGHWVVVSRPKEGVAEYFDSYGGYVDAPLTWTPKNIQRGLGQGHATLHQFFDEFDVYHQFHIVPLLGGFVCGVIDQQCAVRYFTSNIAQLDELDWKFAFHWLTPLQEMMGAEAPGFR